MLPKIKSLSDLNSILLYNNDEESKLEKLENLTSKSFSFLTEFQRELQQFPKIKSPKKHGLENSFQIIPPYYLKNNNLLDVDFYEVIKDDIRNSRSLNEYQLNFIEKLDNERMFEIINLFNECNKMLISIINEC